MTGIIPRIDTPEYQRIGSRHLTDGTTGFISLSPDVSKFKRLLITVGFYSSGFPSYGLVELPVDVFANMAEGIFIPVRSANGKFAENEMYISRLSYADKIEVSVSSGVPTSWYVAVHGIR